MFVIDRFEGDWAVIEMENRATFKIPRSILPADVKEGDVIRLSIRIDTEETRKRAEKSELLLKNFFDK